MIIVIAASCVFLSLAASCIVFDWASGKLGKPQEFAKYADQATKEELQESFGEIDRRLTEDRNQ